VEKNKSRETLMRSFVPRVAVLASSVLVGAGCTTPGPTALRLGADPAAACTALAAATVLPGAIGVPSGAATIESATMVPEVALAVAERGPTPAARITPPTPAFCRVLGQIAPLDPKAPPIRFQVNLPQQWNGRTVQYGGGGFNGTLINASTYAVAESVSSIFLFNNTDLYITGASSSSGNNCYWKNGNFVEMDPGCNVVSANCANTFANQVTAIYVK